MADRKSILSRPILATAIIAVSLYIGVIAVGRYYRYCEDCSRMSWRDALKRAVAIAEPPEFSESTDNFSEIEPGLFVGGSIAKAPPGVNAVLNLCERADPYDVEVNLRMQIADSAPAPGIEWLKEAVDFVADQRKRGRTVYVHCAAGRSRAGMVSTAYLMADRGWTRDEALKFIRERRDVHPNPAFMERLLEWEKIVVPKK
jgi:hypothetical protein